MKEQTYSEMQGQTYLNTNVTTDMYTHFSAQLPMTINEHSGISQFHHKS